MNINLIIDNCYKIARGGTPYASGNWREHALGVTNRRENSFTINYSELHAYYMKFVEEGTKHQDAQHTIRNTFIMLAQYLDEYGNGRRIGLNIGNAKRSGRFSLYRDNPDYRVLVHDRSIEYNSNKGVV